MIRAFVVEVCAEAKAKAAEEAAAAAERAKAAAVERFDALSAGRTDGGRRVRPPPLDVEEGGVVDVERLRGFQTRLRKELASHAAFRHAFRLHQAESRRESAGLPCVGKDILAEAEARVWLAEAEGVAPPALSPAVARAVAAAEWTHIVAGAHRLLMAALRPVLYPSGPAARAVTQHLRARAWALGWVGPAELDCPEPPPQVRPALRLARDVFRCVGRFASPGDLVEAMTAACVCVSAAVEASMQMSGHCDVGADDLLPIVIWTVLRAGDAAAATLATDLMFAGRYAPAAVLRDHRGYFFTSVLSAAEFCRGADARMLRMEPSDMEARMRAAHASAALRVQLAVERGQAGEAGDGGPGSRLRRQQRRAAAPRGSFSDSSDDEDEDEDEEEEWEGEGADGAAGSGAGAQGAALAAGDRAAAAAGGGGAADGHGDLPATVRLAADHAGDVDEAARRLLDQRLVRRAVAARARAERALLAIQAAQQEGSAEPCLAEPVLAEHEDAKGAPAEETSAEEAPAEETSAGHDLSGTPDMASAVVASLRALTAAQAPAGKGLPAMPVAAARRALGAAGPVSSAPQPAKERPVWSGAALPALQRRAREALRRIDASLAAAEPSAPQEAAPSPDLPASNSIAQVWQAYLAAQAWAEQVQLHCARAEPQ
ncbi:hypothetical protein FNF29_07636 [Cafeteria roenbergensis]|uniref:VPS9 domain-containing protein n=1 Tax=Cafeteria roenbergensis TaxID=33653 RepID=A0A5A8C3B4_CAFRO|nr:hypothetical protein FNF29_07636 [Cafeteria roenbergensis]|eukprot:KAA0147009.1 hypothetical protein FNF29_07636 [Cafeteria roenbergensis]